MKKRLWVLVAVFVICFASPLLVSVYAQCNMQEGGVIVCDKKHALSFWQDDCDHAWLEVKFQRSNDGMRTWGDVEKLDMSDSNLNFGLDHQWEGFYRTKFGKRGTILVPFIGIDRRDGNPLVAVKTTEDCGKNWNLHEIKVPIPEKDERLTFVRSLGCPELAAEVVPEYFVMFATFVFADNTNTEYGYGCVISTRDGENWTASLTADGQMPPQCED